MNTTRIKQTIKHLIAAPLVLGLVIFATGCAGTANERSTGESIDDKATSMRVKSALSDDAIYKYPDVKVTTFKGRVQLSGFVDTKDQKSKAADLAKNASGVKEVENNITVKQ
jgi:hyperosmotically inducible periplasmic protein